MGHAQRFPPNPPDGFVCDGANLLTPEEEATITGLSQSFLKSTGAPLYVTTFPSLDGAGISAYGAAVFEAWRIKGGAEKGGLLLIVAKQEREAHVEIGEDWDRDFGEPVKGVMGTEILPALRRRDFRAALLDGAAGLAFLGDRSTSRIVGPVGPPVEARALSGPTTTNETESPTPPDAGKALWTIAGALAALTVGAVAWSRRKKA